MGKNWQLQEALRAVVVSAAATAEGVTAAGEGRGVTLLVSMC